MSGTIEIQSHRFEGTTLKIVIPVKREPVKQPDKE